MMTRSGKLTGRLPGRRLGPDICSHDQRPLASQRHHFQSLTDPRRGKITHPLVDIVTIALCATIAGANEFILTVNRIAAPPRRSRSAFRAVFQSR